LVESIPDHLKEVTVQVNRGLPTWYWKNMEVWEISFIYN
jgi:hypothetical protein